MEIKIENYLSEDEIKNICIEELRNSFKNCFKGEGDRNRIISNITYEIAFDIIDKELDDDLHKIIKEQVKNKILKIDSFSLFHKEDLWGNPASVGQVLLDNAMEESKSLIKEMLEKRIREHDYKECVDDYFMETLKEIIVEKLEGKRI